MRKWPYLSACDTGQGKLTGDGVLGLGRSFVEAGVPTLVLSLWSIPDAPTAALMVEFYKDLHLGHDKAQALRNAMLATMKQFPEPRAWAAFLLLGIPDVSAVLRTVSGLPPAAGTSSYATALPVPDGARDYMQLNDNSFLFMTSMSATQIVAFYREVLKARGYREDSALTRMEQKTFQIVFVGESGSPRFDVGGVEFGQEHAVTVTFSATH